MCQVACTHAHVHARKGLPTAQGAESGEQRAERLPSVVWAHAVCGTARSAKVARPFCVLLVPQGALDMTAKVKKGAPRML